MVSESSFVAGRTRAPRNQWYVAALSEEITQKPLARQLLGDNIVFYRAADGTPVALEDRCAHRAAALSAGKLIGDTIQCFYHGMQYDRTGRCTYIPSQTAIPAQMRVRPYALIEKAPLVWIWMGDAASANPALLPDHTEFGMEGPIHAREGYYRMEIEGNYQLLHENLLDVSHISILHEGSFDSGLICKIEPRVEVKGSRIRIEREVEETLTGNYALTFEYPEGTRARRILRTDAWAPGLSVVTNFFWDLDHPENEPHIQYAIFPITPKNDAACHYFTVIAKNYGFTKASDEFRQFIWNVFLTDKAAIESIQASYDLLGADAPDVSVKADAAALRYRRIIASMNESELSEFKSSRRVAVAS